MTLDELRKNFEAETNRSISMPVAGAIVWTIVGVLSIRFKFNVSIFILLFGTGLIFPIALLIAKFRNENLVSSANPLAKLMGLCVLMVNLLWAVHIPLVLNAPEFVPLSLGVALGLHWVVYSWIIKHPLGIIHAVSRTIMVLLAWYIFPNAQLLAVCIAVVISYLVSIYLMSTRKLQIVWYL